MRLHCELRDQLPYVRTLVRARLRLNAELDVEIANERVLAAREAKLKKAKLSTAEVTTKRNVLVQKIAMLTGQLCIQNKKWSASREKAFSAVLEARTTVELHSTYEVARAAFFRRRWERFRKAILPLLAFQSAADTVLKFIKFITST